MRTKLGGAHPTKLTRPQSVMEMDWRSGDQTKYDNKLNHVVKNRNKQHALSARTYSSTCEPCVREHNQEKEDDEKYTSKKGAEKMLPKNIHTHEVWRI